MQKARLHETNDLERIEQIYEQLLKNLQKREQELGVTNAPPNLKLKAQEYSNALKELRRRLDQERNRNNAENLFKPQTVQNHTHYAETIGGRIVVGNQYGEEAEAVLKSHSLYTLASDNAWWLMELAEVEHFAVDDCIILTNSENFKGWEPHEIQTTILTTQLPIPDDLADIRKEKLAAIEKHYFNAPHYRLVFSYTRIQRTRLP